MTVPTVSVIIIVLNGEAFLGEAIDSVHAQTMGAWELIVVDDGSTDSSRDIVERHAAADARISLVRHTDGGNHGMSATRNLGLSHARGDYVGFLDADDVWLPDKLAAQTEVLRRDPSLGMVYGRTLIWRSWNGSDAGPDFFYDLGVEPDRAYEPTLLFRNLLRNEYQTPTTCNALVRRSVIDAVGGFDTEFRGMFEDQVFFAKVLLRSSVHVDARCWAKYRQHPASASTGADRSTDVLRDHLRFLRALRRHMTVDRHVTIDRLAVERTMLTVRARWFRSQLGALRRRGSRR